MINLILTLVKIIFKQVGSELQILLLVLDQYDNDWGNKCYELECQENLF